VVTRAVDVVEVLVLVVLEVRLMVVVVQLCVLVDIALVWIMVNVIVVRFMLTGSMSDSCSPALLMTCSCGFDVDVTLVVLAVVVPAVVLVVLLVAVSVTNVERIRTVLVEEERCALLTSLVSLSCLAMIMGDTEVTSRLVVVDSTMSRLLESETTASRAGRLCKLEPPLMAVICVPWLLDPSDSFDGA